MKRSTVFLLVTLGIAVASGFLYIRRSSVIAPSPTVATGQGALPGAVTSATTTSAGHSPSNRDPLDSKQPPEKMEIAGAKDPVITKPAPQDYGRIEPVKAAANPQAASVAEALKTKSHPERISAMFPPAAHFDPNNFNKNPSEYLDVSEPGRCFATADPAENVPALKAVGDRFARITQGETVKLSVQGASLAPVTFTSFDLGGFKENNLTSITVRADDKGIAQATFVATPGTLNSCNVLAGSPVASGRVKFTIDVEQAGGKQSKP